jgi:hypothetical protein
MKYIFYHLFYRVYWWNIKVIKEKDFPVLSAYLFVSGLMSINVISLLSILLVFIIKDPQAAPIWNPWIIILITFLPNYFFFIHKKKYKDIIDNSQNLDKVEKRKRDIAILIYILLTFIILILVV